MAVSTKDKLIDRFIKADENSAATIDESILKRYENLAVDIYSTRQVSVGEIGWMAAQKFARALKNGLDNYQNLYFTKVMKIDLVYITVIKAIIAVYDTLNDPLMGILFDKTRTRWGKARPYILATPLPYFLSTAIMYCGALIFGNTGVNDPKKIIFLFIMLFCRRPFPLCSTSLRITTPRCNPPVRRTGSTSRWPKATPAPTAAIWFPASICRC